MYRMRLLQKLIQFELNLLRSMHFLSVDRFLATALEKEDNLKGSYWHLHSILFIVVRIKIIFRL